MTHVECADCGIAYNGKTGKSNTTGIYMYNLAMLVAICGAVAPIWLT